MNIQDPIKSLNEPPLPEFKKDVIASNEVIQDNFKLPEALTEIEMLPQTKSDDKGEKYKLYNELKRAQDQMMKERLINK